MLLVWIQKYLSMAAQYLKHVPDRWFVLLLFALPCRRNQLAILGWFVSSFCHPSCFQFACFLFLRYHSWGMLLPTAILQDDNSRVSIHFFCAYTQRNVYFGIFWFSAQIVCHNKDRIKMQSVVTSGRGARYCRCSLCTTLSIVPGAIKIFFIYSPWLYMYASSVRLVPISLSVQLSK